LEGYLERQRRHPVGSIEWLRDQIQALGRLDGLEATSLVKDKESREKFSDLLSQPEISSLAPVGATPGDIALALEQRIRALVNAIPDRHERRIARVALATEPNHRHLGVTERFDGFLREQIGISWWTFRVRRDRILLSLARSLKEGPLPPAPLPAVDIESLIRSTPPGEPPALDEETADEAMAFAADRLQQPFYRRYCVDALAAWCAAPTTEAEALRSLLVLSRDLQKEPDVELAKSAVRLLQPLVEHGVADSRDLTNATHHPSWEVRTAAVSLLVRIADDYVFRTAAEIQLSYWMPLKLLSRHATERAAVLSKDERAAAAALLARLAERREISEQTRRRLLEASALVQQV
jgi:hypothetical protein